MAVLYSGAEYRQLAGKSTTLLDTRVINVHTMVWWLTACEAYFAQAGKPYSHFGTEGDGRVVQWQDLQYRAASDLNGNPFCISIENADKGSYFPDWSGSDVPRFTAAQANELAHLIAWLCVRFNIPPVLLNDSLPGRVGPSYHRLGIDPWRVDGGVLYSSAYGKVCPGDRRIAQLRDEIIPHVQDLIGDDMPTADEVANAVWNKMLHNHVAGTDQPAGMMLGFTHLEASNAAALRLEDLPTKDELAAAMAALPDAVWMKNLFNFVEQIDQPAGMLLGFTHVEAHGANHPDEPVEPAPNP